jgi:hypothetical protein
MWLSQLLACLIGCLVVVNPAQVPYVRGGQLFFLQHKNMHAKGGMQPLHIPMVLGSEP